MSLSDKIYLIDECDFNKDKEMMYPDDVKEFIKELKLNFCGNNHVGAEINRKIIDELAGEKLIGEVTE